VFGLAVHFDQLSLEVAADLSKMEAKSFHPEHQNSARLSVGQ
jgi:hypothetical protein